jgi:hypothetical protein
MSLIGNKQKCAVSGCRPRACLNLARSSLRETQADENGRLNSGRACSNRRPCAPRTSRSVSSSRITCCRSVQRSWWLRRPCIEVRQKRRHEVGIPQVYSVRQLCMSEFPSMVKPSVETSEDRQGILRIEIPVGAANSLDYLEVLAVERRSQQARFSVRIQ